MIIVLGSVEVRQGQLEQALRVSQAHVARSRLEAGCIAHAVHHDADQPLRLVFVEQWADRAALDAHFRVPASRAFARALRELAATPPAMTLYDATELPLVLPPPGPP